MADLVKPATPSQLRLFNRTCEVTIANQPSPPAGGASAGGYFAQEPNALLVTGGSRTDLRIEFSIKRHLGKTPNPAVIKIYNLSPDSRARFNRMPVYVLLRAGHDGVLRPLFEGNVGNSISLKKEATWETKIQVADGGRAYAHAEFSRSYAPPVRALQVLGDAAASMGLSLPSEALQSSELKQVLESGVSAHGPSRDTLTKVLARFGFGWSVQNGRLQILKQGATNQRRAWVIDADAGMIESPESTLPHKPGKIAELTVKVLLFPEIIPGDSIQLTSRSFTHAVFRVNDVHHAGDTRGNDWTTTLKCVPPGTPLTSTTTR